MSIRLAKLLAQNSNHDSYWHGAVAMRGGCVVGIGYNHGEKHAEEMALQNIWPNKRKGVKVISVRITRTGRMSMAKPCPKCEAYMKQHGVKSVLWSNHDGKLETTKL